jgi:hypothetical protein
MKKFALVEHVVRLRDLLHQCEVPLLEVIGISH